MKYCNYLEVSVQIMQTAPIRSYRLLILRAINDISF